MATHQAAPQPPSTTYNRADQFTQHEGQGGLKWTDLDPSDPIAQFEGWYSNAQSLKSQNDNSKPLIPHPESCTLSTASLPSGRVSARMVYLKEVETKPPAATNERAEPRRPGFVIYSNFGTSQKSKDLATNPWASLVFWWEPIERQVRVEGRTERLTREESQVYYGSRVRGSRIGAWASQQSRVLEPRKGVDQDDDGRVQLDGWVKDIEKKFEGTEDIPVPEFWGGLRIVPEKVEFWQGRNNRLHDRFVYERDEATGKWSLNRLSP